MSDLQPREPDSVSVQWLTGVLSGRPGLNVVFTPPHDLVITKSDGSTVAVHLNNIYTVSEADVVEILASHQNINAIVTVSAWNSYSTAARIAARNAGVGLFTAKEFLGAINFTGDPFTNYISPDERKEIERERRRRAGGL